MPRVTTTATAADAKSAGGEVARPRPPSKQPGYVTPCLVGKVGVTTRVEPPLRDGFKAVAKLLGTTSDALLRDLLVCVVTMYQEPGQLKAAVAEGSERYQETLNKAARQLADAHPS